MANTIRIKRRTTGSAGAPASLENAELAFNEVSDILYYGKGTGGAGGTATEIIPIGGNGAFVDLSSNQTIAGTKTFSNTVSADISGNAGTVTNGVYTTDTGTVTNTMLANDSVTIGTTSIALGDSSTTLAGLTSVTSTDFIGNLTGSADSADTWTTPRDLSLTGDGTATLSNVDGSSNVSGALTLATVNINVGTYTKVTVNAKGLVTAASDATLNDLGAPTSSFSMNDYAITDLADPTNPQDAATKAYVDSVAQGLVVKQAVIATTTGNITLSGLSTQAGGDWGSSLVAGDRVLVKNQTLSQNNGIYVANSSTWTRASDADTWNELISAFTFVQTGTTEADTGWVCTIDAGGTLGTDPVTWAQFSGAGTYTAGTGLTLTGNQFSISNTAVTANSYGAATQTLLATVNAQGQLTSLSATEITVDGGTF